MTQQRWAVNRGGGRGQGKVNPRKGTTPGNFLSCSKCCMSWGFPGGSVVKESACQCRRHRFDPWPGKIPHATEQPHTCSNSWACALEPGSYQWVHALHVKSTCPRACDWHQEKPQQWEARILIQLEKSPRNNKDHTQPKINTIIFLKIPYPVVLITQIHTRGKTHRTLQGAERALLL